MQPAVSDAHVREAAAAVLAHPPYSSWRGSDSTVEWLKWLLNWLDGLTYRFDMLHSQAPFLYWVIMGGSILLACLLFLHIAWSLRAALATSAPSAADGAADGPSLAGEAEGLAQQGRFLEAARRLQLAAIELLLRDRAITLSRSDPNRILRRRVQSAPLADGDRRDLLQLVDRLEVAWFRDRAEDADLYRAWQSLYSRLLHRPSIA